MDCTVVLPNLLIGSYPETLEDVEFLRREKGVTAVLSLQTDEDHEHLQLDWEALGDYYRLHGIEVYRVPIRDFDREDLRRHLADGVRALDGLLKQGETVYLHCTAGMGRAPSVAVAYLHWIEGWDLEEAIDRVLSCRHCCPDAEVIRAVSYR